MAPLVGTKINRPDEYYGRIAFVYDEQRFRCRCGRALDSVETHIVADLLADGVRVLDVGTGTGRFALAASSRVPMAIGVDASPNMIAAAKLKLSRSPPRSSISFLVADAASLPFPTASFDAAVSVKLLSHYDDIEPYVSEMARVLAPRGRLILDVPHKLAKSYRKFGVELPIESYEDYFHPLAEVAGVMRRHSIDLSRRITYSILPASLVHRALCSRPRIVSLDLLQRLFDTRPGLLCFVEGVKRS